MPFVARIGDSVAGKSTHQIFAPGDPAFTALPLPAFPYPVIGTLTANTAVLGYSAMLEGQPIAMEGATGETAGCIVMDGNVLLGHSPLITVPPPLLSLDPGWNKCKVISAGHTKNILFSGVKPVVVTAPVQHCHDVYPPFLDPPLVGADTLSRGTVTGPGWLQWNL